MKIRLFSFLQLVWCLSFLHFNVQISHFLGQRPMSQTVLTKPSLEKIHKIIAVKFDVVLPQQHLLNLIGSQSEELKHGLLADKIDPIYLDLLIETISEKITGMHYPTEHSTPYYKEYFRKKLKENKDSFFGL